MTTYPLRAIRQRQRERARHEMGTKYPAAKIAITPAVSGPKAFKSGRKSKAEVPRAGAR
jgi:hypothetical protein